jgi:YidC/Oxa1 family membrane protein insertase
MSQNFRTRLFLIFTIFLLGLLIWSKWQEQFVPKPVTSPIVESAKILNSAEMVPQTVVTSPEASASHASGHRAHPLVQTNSLNSVEPPKFAFVTTDLLKLKIDLHNGDITSASLLKYPEELGSENPVELLYQSGSGQYVAQTGLLGLEDLSYTASEINTVLDKNSNQVSLQLKAVKNGLVILKTYVLDRGSYDISVSYSVTNASQNIWQGQLYGQLVRTPPDKHASLYSQFATFIGAAVSTPNSHYQSLSFSKISKAPLQASGPGGWAAMVQHYFISAWIPGSQTQNDFYAKDYGDHNYGVGAISSLMTVKPGETANMGGHFYIGPTLTKALNQAAPYLSLTIDYGWLWFIAKYLFVVLNFIHSLIGNWGWSIVVITLLIKLVFFPLSHKSYSSMAKMRLLQPKMKLLQEQHAGDRAALQKAMMALYSKEQANPLGGCLPIVIQIPIFIALYWMLMASVELRQAPFIGWIHDLSIHDPLYILPVLTGALMLMQQILGPKPPDKTQMYVMMSMPLVFMIFMLKLPAGLGLYMVVNIGVSIAQQWLIIRMTGNAPKKSSFLKGHAKKSGKN